MARRLTAVECRHAHSNRTRRRRRGAAGRRKTWDARPHPPFGGGLSPHCGNQRTVGRNLVAIAFRRGGFRHPCSYRRWVLPGRPVAIAFRRGGFRHDGKLWTGVWVARCRHCLSAGGLSPHLDLSRHKLVVDLVAIAFRRGGFRHDEAWTSSTEGGLSPPLRSVVQPRPRCAVASAFRRGGFRHQAYRIGSCRKSAVAMAFRRGGFRHL